MEVRRSGKVITVIHRHLQNDGNQRIFEVQASPLWGADGQLDGIIQASRDVTERHAAEERLKENKQRLRQLAHYDPLTDLPNRLLFNDRLQQAIVRATRGNQQVALLFLDLDRFKNINDSLGHQAGDHLLRETSLRLRDCVRKTDTVARLGGDEFLVILEGFQGLDDVRHVAHKILSSLALAVNVATFELYVTTSIGISLFPDDGQSNEELLRCADVAMYRAKELGRNNFQFYSQSLGERSHERLVLEGHLRSALEDHQLLLHYQPQVDLTSRQIVGVEALVRWNHPERGMIPPIDFIPMAEETGLIVPLGEMVLRQACKQMRRWQQSGDAPAQIAVNISARQFREANFVDLIDRILKETDLDPRCLELEITESVIMENVFEAIMTLTDLKSRGLQLSIDDFGTGYSSLAYLKRFPIDRLKIDKSFVRDITTDPNDAAIAESIIALARSMALEVVAEGIETEDQLGFLHQHGCRIGQGYLLGRPVAADQLTPLLSATISPPIPTPH